MKNAQHRNTATFEVQRRVETLSAGTVRKHQEVLCVRCSALFELWWHHSLQRADADGVPRHTVVDAQSGFH